MKYEYKSILSPVIYSFLDMKHELGFKYESESWKLKELDLLVQKVNLNEVILTKELVDLFIQKKPNECNLNITRRVEVIRELAKYMVNHGYKAYIMPSLPRGSYISTFTPYIFTNEELKRIFIAVDQYAASFSLDNHYYPQREKYPVILRILYSTGMRIGEVVHLQLRDVDFKKNTFVIRNTKNNKERKIPVHSVMMKYLNAYIIKQKIFDNESYIFSNNQNSPIDTSTVYHTFRKILHIAGIPHGGKGKGPRIHSFRHTFCVHRLRDWVLEGRNITALFPYLCAYMGHADTRCTEYYLRLTSELYPNIIAKTEKYFNEGSDTNE